MCLLLPRGFCGNHTETETKGRFVESAFIDSVRNNGNAVQAYGKTKRAHSFGFIVETKKFYY